MAKLFRLWEKKRGERRTGSHLVGRLGEALFFGLLFFLGLVSLTVLVGQSILHPLPERYQFGFGFWLMVMVLASFVLIGGGGLIYSVFHVGTSAERRLALVKRATDLDLIGEVLNSSEYPAVPGDSNLTNSPGTALTYRLPNSQTPAWRLLAAATFCVVWNSLAAVLVLLTVNSLSSSHPEWFLALFVIPFLGIGVWAVYYVVRQLMTLTSVGPTQVEVSDHPLVPGGHYEYFVSQVGRLNLERFEVALVCEEVTNFQQGTDVRSETHRVFSRSLYRGDAIRIAAGSPFEYRGSLDVPEQAMHSFQANYNAIEWKLVVSGTGTQGAMFARSFPLVVYPTETLEA